MCYITSFSIKPAPGYIAQDGSTEGRQRKPILLSNHGPPTNTPQTPPQSLPFKKPATKTRYNKQQYHILWPGPEWMMEGN
ncbi:hypothetical protein E6O75_ATG04984 [Venturia nashicola]|uniref:Uncharacterized protein n=1 Tax=Venturia nashicola TaxID=86259 RepID=A0A4Z1PIC8_9PEZI|nr:hypothetical protein E6O75_ATG04984 [Venturia nashicola]